jgi:hypothetical protein
MNLANVAILVSTLYNGWGVAIFHVVLHILNLPDLQNSQNLPDLLNSQNLPDSPN